MIRRFLIAAFALLASWPALAAVEIEEVTSPGGITAWLVRDNSIPFLALDIRFQGGASLDPLNAQGAAFLMTGLLEEGTGEMDAQAFAAASEGLAAEFRFNAYRDSVSISTQVLTQNRDEALDLLRRALVEPRFDDVALERVRGQVLSIITSDAQDPETIAGARFRALAFGDHPYARPIEGTLDSIAALTRDDVVAAHLGTMARDRVFVGASGDITAAELGPLLDRLLGGLPAEGAPMPGPAPYNLTGGTTVVDYPTPQSVAVFGHRGIARNDPEFFPAFVLNQIIGGGNFRSRLMRELRQERGLTYGAYSYLALFDYAPMMMGQFSSSNDLVAEAVAVLRSEWVDIAANGVTAEEVEAAKTYLTGDYPLRFDGNRTIAGILSGMQIDGMPIDYIATRNARVDAVTTEDVRRVAARLLDPEGLQVVVVGQPVGLETTD